MKAVTIACVSLSGGQGKTTTAMALALKAARQGIETLVIDLDPQRNLTTFLRLETPEGEPTLLNLIRGEAQAIDAFHPVPDRENLYGIPAPPQRELVNAQSFLSSQGNSSAVLRLRLKPIIDAFRLIVIDSPPQKSHLTLAALGAANSVVIPAEAAVKGVNSVIETLDLLEELREIEAFNGDLLGILPIRARLFGNNMSREALDNIAVMQAVGDTDSVLPALIESEYWKKAANQACLPSELDPTKADLEFPIDLLLKRVEESLVRSLQLPFV